MNREKGRGDGTNDSTISSPTIWRRFSPCIIDKILKYSSSERVLISPDSNIVLLSVSIIYLLTDTDTRWLYIKCFCCYTPFNKR